MILKVTLLIITVQVFRGSSCPTQCVCREDNVWCRDKDLQDNFATMRGVTSLSFTASHIDLQRILSRFPDVESVSVEDSKVENCKLKGAILMIGACFEPDKSPPKSYKEREQLSPKGGRLEPGILQIVHGQLSFADRRL